MIGQTVSHYEITEKLGGGGMGVVYKAWDTRLRRHVALKFLPPEMTWDEDSKTRFRREAQGAADLGHPNICNIHEIDETPDGRLFICMTHYEGETLKKKIAHGPLSVKVAADMADQVARGLAEAHKNGIVHRDIKPANLMVTKEGRVKIVDFGLVKLRGRSRVTDTGKTPGTLVYMSPEQARGEEVDGRSDIFSLGVVLYEMLTGEIPFDGDHEAAVLYGIMNRDPERLSALRSDIPGAFQEIVDKALQKDVKKRYQNATELMDDMRRARDGSHPRGWLRKLRAPLVLAVAVVGLLALWPTIEKFITRPPDQQYIAVLPFENVGPVNKDFSAGLMWTLTSKLTQLQQFHGSLVVIPASEVRARGVTSAGEARRVFGVNLVLAGSVQRLGGDFRLTLSLIEVGRKAPRQLRSAVFNAQQANVSLQDDIVIKAAGLLNIEMGPQVQQVLAAGGTAMAAAYDLYLQGRGYLVRHEKLDNINEAISLFERAIEEDSLYVLAYAGLGEAYFRKYRETLDTQWVEPARESCRRAVELNDLLSEVHVTVGMIHRGTGEYQQGIEAFQRALALDPSSGAAHSGLARTYANLQRFAEAESTYQNAIALRPGYWDGYEDLGLFYYRQGRYEEALTAVGRVVELTPNNSRGYNLLGAIYYAQERWGEARPMFERAVEIEPNFYRAYSNLGVTFYNEGRYAEAAAATEKALEINDTSYIPWANLANAYYWLPDKREHANDIYRRVVEMAEEQRQVNPKDPDLLSSMAGYYAIIGEGSRALSLLQEAFALAPKDWGVLYNHGHAYEQLGDRDQALQWIEKALDAGYPLKEVEQDPWLVDLRTDTRFQDLVAKRRE